MDEVEQGKDRLLWPSEVAEMTGVDAKTVTRWVTAGKLKAYRTLGGHRRYKESEVLEAIALANAPKDES